MVPPPLNLCRSSRSNANHLSSSEDPNSGSSSRCFCPVRSAYDFFTRSSRSDEVSSSIPSNISVPSPPLSTSTTSSSSQILTPEISTSAQSHTQPQILDSPQTPDNSSSRAEKDLPQLVSPEEEEVVQDDDLVADETATEENDDSAMIVDDEQTVVDAPGEAPIPFRTNPWRPGLLNEPARPIRITQVDSPSESTRERYRSLSRRSEEETTARRRISGHSNYNRVRRPSNEESFPDRQGFSLMHRDGVALGPSGVPELAEPSVPPPRPPTTYSWYEVPVDEPRRHARRRAIMDQIDRRRRAERPHEQTTSNPSPVPFSVDPFYARNRYLQSRLNQLDSLQPHLDEGDGLESGQTPGSFRRDLLHRNVREAVDSRLPSQMPHFIRNTQPTAPTLWGEIPPLPIDTVEMSGHDPMNPRLHRLPRAYESRELPTIGFPYRPSPSDGWYGMTGEEHFRPSAMFGDLAAYRPPDLNQFGVSSPFSRISRLNYPDPLVPGNPPLHPAQHQMLRSPLPLAEISQDMPRAAQDQLVKTITHCVTRMPADSRRKAAESVVESMTWREAGFKCSEREMPRDENCSVCHDEYVPDAEVTLTPCNHMYHEACLSTWLATPNCSSCPMCRRDLAALGCITKLVWSRKREDALPLWLAAQQ